MSLRLAQLRTWIARHHAVAADTCRFEPVAGDASLRGYCRVYLPDGTTRMLMDAPPELEESHAFVAIGRSWRAAGLPVPAIHAVDLDQGFLELDDLGDDSLHHHFVDTDSARRGTAQAIDLLLRLQRLASPAELPPYSAAFMEEELERFPDWGLGRWLGLETPSCWATTKHQLLARIAALPEVAVHRDFDAMNLMRVDGELALIDFQGALAGPLGYDLISLLRGRYQRWSRAEMDSWIDDFHRRSREDFGAHLPDAATFRAGVEAIGAQRQLKILGQFCRLCLRDGKPRYLDWLPHFYAQLDAGLEALPELAEFHAWLRETYHPAMQARLARHHAEQAQEPSKGAST
ncbi:phosphotransferase [Salinicola sp. RZ23]|uniref:aminoglycoside phosphotransferase family protein n=1 Tax=Salinicola sp. RZ23 TaxID=1949087 RepID=UPI000DA24E54|nr:phosphotransferase [Salinicola sp. RZ23]